MMRATRGMVFVVCFFGATWGTALASGVSAPTPETSMKDLERNVALGEALALRQGSADELKLVQKLADQGLRVARGLVAKKPSSAEAQYLLGSWLLYGYQVVESESVFFDAYGEEHREKMSVTAQGLSDNPTDGLKALQAAHVLAPQNGRYFVDYGAALYDWGRPDEAMSALKKAWVSAVEFTPQEKGRIALLMSDLLADQGEAPQAREWVYRALSLNSGNLEIVSRLRELDRLQTETLKAQYEAAAPEVIPSGEEVAPGEVEATDEVAPQDEEATEEELAPSDESTATEEGEATGQTDAEDYEGISGQ